MTELAAMEQQYGVVLNAKRDLVAVRGQGARLWADDGTEYIDCVGGIGVASHWATVIQR